MKKFNKNDHIYAKFTLYLKSYFKFNYKKSSVKIVQIEEQTHHTFWAQIKIKILFFPNCRTLKFLKVKRINQLRKIPSV